MKNILVINPGSTSTKFAVYHDLENVFEKTLRHTEEELAPFSDIASQYNFRLQTILSALQEAGITYKMDIIVGRGGLLHPLESGVYEVNDAMKSDLMSARYGEHACNLGGLIASQFAKESGCKAVIVDPVVVDEMTEIAHVGGHPKFPRVSIFHALNQKAIAKRYARDIEKDYNTLNLVVAHMGGGVSVGAHQLGKVVDVNNALEGEGPFSPERSGTMPSGALVDACFSGKYTEQEVRKMIKGQGGLMGHCGTNDAYKVELAAESGTDAHAKLIFDAMAYNVAKYIGAMAVVLEGKVDAILLTGGIAYGKAFCDFIEKKVKFIAPVKVYAGEDELGALAMNGLSVLEGEKCHKYIIE